MIYAIVIFDNRGLRRIYLSMFWKDCGGDTFKAQSKHACVCAITYLCIEASAGI